jgi:hypothetical protein
MLKLTRLYFLSLLIGAGASLILGILDSLTLFQMDDFYWKLSKLENSMEIIVFAKHIFSFCDISYNISYFVKDLNNSITKIIIYGFFFISSNFNFFGFKYAGQ